MYTNTNISHSDMKGVSQQKQNSNMYSEID